ncbi:hypothetical protein AMATHDRAFT_140664 [Amanita thiersii Skay4041]|uniref:SH3 domain-containing protein n=1 Tax=Amanita thiersii Skay4041 TaxID=703135 RepID=A0A2A9NV61_9AGAR|nr:hypothetical protein AMATHDRAFT_140664 [Amanita thiersii Skay4041]
MAVRTQPSSSTLSKYSILQSPGTDPITNTTTAATTTATGPAAAGSVSRDFCNNFWGEGDDGPAVLFLRMRNAMKTSEELRNFWFERAALEEEFGRRLSLLARRTIGSDETGELKNSLQVLITETQRQSESHVQLATTIRQNLMEPVSHFLDKQSEHKRTVQTPIEKKLKKKQSQASYVSKAREKYEGDSLRIKSYRQQATLLQGQGQDLDRLQARLKRAMETVRANEKDYANFVLGLSDLSAEWEVDWKNFCDSCQDLEEERMEFTKDNVWNYANLISTLCVSDDESCENVRTALDQLEPDRDLLAFVDAHGTGNMIIDPPTFVSYDGQRQSSSSTASQTYRTAQFERVSRKPEPVYQNAPDALNSQMAQDGIQVYDRENRHNAPTNYAAKAQTQAALHSSGHAAQAHSTSGYSNQASGGVPAPEETQNKLRRMVSLRRQSQPLPALPGRAQEVPVPAQPPVPVTDAGNRILFLVKALYDYKATIDEEFDFQVGDIIAVTATPDDGWWSGELLDEARREPGRHIFPSNYVCLF